MRRPDVGRLVEFGVQPESGCTQRRSPASTARRRDPTLNVFWFQNQRHSSPLLERVGASPVISEVRVPEDLVSCGVLTRGASHPDRKERLDNRERAILRARTDLLDPAAPAWRVIVNAEDARVALRILTAN